MPRKPSAPEDVCPYCGTGTSLQVAVVARHGRAALIRTMWCASCRGTYVALRRLLPEMSISDSRRARAPSRFDADKLRRSVSEPLRKPPHEGFRDPFSGEPIPPALNGLAAEFVVDFVAEYLSRAGDQANGEVTTDTVARLAHIALYRMHLLAFLRSAVHHRMFPSHATPQEIEELASQVEHLVNVAHHHSAAQDLTLPTLREPPSPLLCPRCNTQRVARRSRSSTLRGLEQQPASCSHCGQRFTWEWGSLAPLVVISPDGESLFEQARFRNGIRASVRKLPGTAAIWSDEKLITSAVNTASISATPFIRPLSDEYPLPAIDSRDLWLAAASALRSIHPLAAVRYALHSGAVQGLDWSDSDNASRLRRIESIALDISRRHFGAARFPEMD
jgi:transcriptional regulator NrdR family protein